NQEGVPDPGLSRGAAGDCAFSGSDPERGLGAAIHSLHSDFARPHRQSPQETWRDALGVGLHSDLPWGRVWAGSPALIFFTQSLSNLEISVREKYHLSDDR